MNTIKARKQACLPFGLFFKDDSLTYGTLYVVATPIGNLDDLPPRAVRALSEAALIAAEDTRASGVLLARFGIKTPMASCHKFNEAAKLAHFMEVLQSGRDVALISDAGTPCLSDPGYRLIACAAEAGVPITGVPGACAAVTAVSISGFDAASFLFIGFLPRSKSAIVDKLSVLVAYGTDTPPLLVFYESPHRIAATLTLLVEHYPQARLCLCNDLTKKFERIYRGTPAEVLAAVTENTNAEKGEYTCVVEYRFVSPAAGADEDDAAALTLEARLADMMAKRGCSLKDAIQALSAEGTQPKKEIYAASLRLKAWFTSHE